jgi:hypothetical protein
VRLKWGMLIHPEPRAVRTSVCEAASIGRHTHIHARTHMPIKTYAHTMVRHNNGRVAGEGDGGAAYRGEVCAERANLVLCTIAR